jgi:hypothetical protein
MEIVGLIPDIVSSTNLKSSTGKNEVQLNLGGVQQIELDIFYLC